MNKETFIKYLKELNIEISDNQFEMLNKFFNLLVEKNKVMNLTSITDKEEVYLKHFYDSLTLCRLYNFNENINILDIGTGAGFPGIVLKIVFPNIKLYLLDSNNKRIIFLQEVIKELELNDVTLLNTRAEELDKKYIDYFDVVVSRAVANLQILTELSLPYVKVNGYFLSLKGNAGEEIINSKNIINKLNGSIDIVDEFLLPIENSKRMIIKIKKNKKNPECFPRRYDKIKKSLKK